MSAASVEAIAWTLAITCPRPANLARDDFHVQPHYVAKAAADFMGPNARLDLTQRTVRLHVEGADNLPNPQDWHERLALALSCLWLDTRAADGTYHLPQPVRTEIRTRAATDFPRVTSAGHAPPTDGDRLT